MNVLPPPTNPPTHRMTIEGDIYQTTVSYQTSSPEWASTSSMFETRAHYHNSHSHYQYDSENDDQHQHQQLQERHSHQHRLSSPQSPPWNTISLNEPEEEDRYCVPLLRIFGVTPSLPPSLPPFLSPYMCVHAYECVCDGRGVLVQLASLSVLSVGGNSIS